MIHIILFEPEIPPNTGNIIRLCANTNSVLHLIHPLGFLPNDKQLKRAGLDYHEWARVHHHQDYAAFLQQMQPQRIFACSTRGQTHHTQVHYRTDDMLLFGPETRGLPTSLLSGFSEERTIRVPMAPSSRSLNLSNTVAIVLYEALRQIGFNMLSLA